MDLEQHGGLGGDGLLVVAQMCSCWWRPTSRRMAPLTAMISGGEKSRRSPPVAPGMMTSRPSARALRANITAAALLFSTRAASAPVSFLQQPSR